MIEIAADLWHYDCDLRVITTNGDVNALQQAVMGRGCAKQCAERYPTIRLEFGEVLRRRGNRVHMLRHDLASFPVKHHWHEKADLDLIWQSCTQLTALVNALEVEVCAVPRPGCGNGQLDYARDVRPLLLEWWERDDRFHILTQ